MTTRVIATDDDLKSLIQLLDSRKKPFTVDIVAGKKRSLEQNALAWKWYGEIAQQLGDRTIPEAHRYCKLEIGVPILRASSTAFRETYDRHIKPLDYHKKMDFIGLISVTSIMTTTQLTQYMDEITRRFAEQGVMLTHPDDLGGRHE